MLALRPSSRGARLHTFEHEDRVYTSTPTKIGGHCLDHIRSGLALNWRSERSQIEKVCADSSNANNNDAERPPISSTFGSRGRFGGLCGVVLQLSPPTPHLDQEFSLPIGRQETSFMTRFSTPLDLPPNIPFQVGNTSSATASFAAASAAAAGAAWQQQQEFGPQWPAEGVVAVASRSESDRPFWDDRREHFRQVASAATGHTGALMAVMLSKLANSTDGPSADDSFDAVNCVGKSSSANPAPIIFTDDVGATATAKLAAAELPVIPFSSSLAGTAAAPATTAPTRTELHRSVDAIAEGLASPSDISAEGTVTSTSSSRSGSWAWKARLQQAPAYSKLHRYSFVRELGRGAHGTILLVRKKVAPTASRARSGYGNRDTSTTVIAAGSASAARDGAGTTGGLRVLKESQHLKEAVNEARLLLLAGSGGDGAGGRGTSGFRAAVKKAAADDDNVSVGPKRAVVGAAKGVGEGKWRAAGGGRAHQSGDVVQVMRNGISGINFIHPTCYKAGRPGGVSGYPRAWYRSVS